MCGIIVANERWALRVSDVDKVVDLIDGVCAFRLTVVASLLVLLLVLLLLLFFLKLSNELREVAVCGNQVRVCS